MARYTITIHSLIKNNFNFGMTSYPIFDENYRNILNHKILYHYFENEIGFETAELFKLYLNQKLDEIMPYYNELYKAQKKLIDENLIFTNVNIKEELTGSTTKNDTNNRSRSTNSSSSSASQNSASGNSKNLFQDTPQGNISTTDIDSQTWATNITLDTNSTSSSISDTSTINGTDATSENLHSNGTNEYIKNIAGNNGNKYSIDVLNDIKNKLLNIDMLIINELGELFMGLL